MDKYYFRRRVEISNRHAADWLMPRILLCGRYLGVKRVRGGDPPVTATFVLVCIVLLSGVELRTCGEQICIGSELEIVKRLTICCELCTVPT